MVGGAATETAAGRSLALLQFPAGAGDFVPGAGPEFLAVITS